MRQADLNRAVALATGESISTIKRLGFLLDGPLDDVDPDSDVLGPYVLDWDLAEAARRENEAAFQDDEPAGTPPLDRETAAPCPA
ncbi:hypothetical protein [Lignipirellula cremea]|uniref:Uncharacterized protein n=1 Tax=Lignipirellula cremea TaxID=2528010 RepID=A0A518DKH7_9BACT|nr:hypothetical protein [Lignipirellula cremea]QDU92337.1 hypothetical protein Pla8534_00820 [Lignipirellula cremea]